MSSPRLRPHFSYACLASVALLGSFGTGACSSSAAPDTGVPQSASTTPAQPSAGAVAASQAGNAVSGRPASAAGSTGLATAGASSAGHAAGAVGASVGQAGAGAAAIAGTTAAGSGPTNNLAGSGGTAGSNSPAAGSGGAGASAAGSGGEPSTAGAPSGSGAGKVWKACRFHFGAIADVARDRPDLVRELDFFTPGWMGLKDTFDMEHVCNDTKPGATFEAQVPAIVSYVAAFYAKRTGNLQDCNVAGATATLCATGAQLIKRDLTKILAIYESYADGFARCYGTTRPIIFMMEPDFYQYTVETQNQPWSPAEAGQIMTQFVQAIRKHLPNAVFSMDISPWVKPDNGSDNGKQWFSNFDLSLFTFVNTSGGHTDGSTATIRDSNKMTWRGVHEATGKPILADTGYGVNGRSEGHDPVWDDVTNLNARIADGVTSLSQYNPSTDWGSTLARIRSQLKPPSVCP